MNITICHLYYDIMNLYGENGNFKVLCRHLENAGFTVEKTYKTINEKKDFSAYNIIYMGCGTEENQKLALNELLNEKQALNNFLNDDTKLAIFTGNSFEILGESIISADKKIYNCLNIYNFKTIELSEKRFNKDSLCRFEAINEKIVGYINKSSETFGIETPMFKVLLGTGNSEKDQFEGFFTKNCLCTHLIGPLLARNPSFTKYIISLISEKNNFVPQLTSVYENEEQAYRIVLNELNKLIN